MAESAVFAVLADTIVARTELSRPVARGAVRLVLKEAGLDASTLNRAQAEVIIDKLMPTALERAGVTETGGVCAALRDSLQKVDADSVPESAASVFSRFGSG